MDELALKDMARVVRAALDLEPHLDRALCYGSTCSEDGGNAAVRDLRLALKPFTITGPNMEKYDGTS